jgi:hypothetical protein
MADYHFAVFSNPAPGKNAELAQWYDDQHIPDVLAVPGFVAAQRFALAPGSATASHTVLAVYEIRTDDIAATMAELRARAGTPQMPLAQGLGVDSMSCLYEAVGPRRTA